MKKSMIRPNVVKLSWLCTLVYFASYLMRINFAVMMVKVIEETGKTKTELAVVVTALTVAYGIGQVLSGLVGDKVKPQYMLTFGLGLAAACNVAMFFCTSVTAMSVTWCINGVAHSLLWPPMVRMMSLYFSDEEYSYGAVRVSWGSQFATIFLYLLCPVLLMALPWRVILLFCAAGGTAINVIFTIFGNRILKRMTPVTRNKVNGKTMPKEKRRLPGYVWLPTVLIMLGIALQGMLRDGVTTWMPSYLKESFGIPDEYSIFITVTLAVFGILSFTVFDLLHRKVFRNEVFCAVMIFACSAVCAFGLYFANQFLQFAPLDVLLMAMIVACMHGINLMLISVVPKRFAKSGRVATFSGILNACTYVGSAIATVGFAALQEATGSWGPVLLLWGGICVVGTALCLIASPVWRRFRKNYADNPNV